MTVVLGIISTSITAIVALISVFTGIRSKNPTKRSYWEKEFQDRIGSSCKWPSDERLKKRAELAVSYLDADEAIRRSRLPGPAASWFAAVGAYVYGAGCVLVFGMVNKGGTEGSGLAVLCLVGGLAFSVICVWALIDAINSPEKRSELQRILVEIMALPDGAEAIRSQPETFVSFWTNRKHQRRIKKATKQIKDKSHQYKVWAEALYSECMDPSTRVLFKVPKDSSALARHPRSSRTHQRRVLNSLRGRNRGWAYR